MARSAAGATGAAAPLVAGGIPARPMAGGAVSAGLHCLRAPSGQTEAQMRTAIAAARDSLTATIAPLRGGRRGTSGAVAAARPARACRRRPRPSSALLVSLFVLG